MMCSAISQCTWIFSHLTVRSAMIYIQNNQPTNFLKSDITPTAAQVTIMYDEATVHRSFFLHCLLVVTRGRTICPSHPASRSVYLSTPSSLLTSHNSSSFLIITICLKDQWRVKGNSEIKAGCSASSVIKNLSSSYVVKKNLVLQQVWQRYKYK